MMAPRVGYKLHDSGQKASAEIPIFIPGLVKQHKGNACNNMILHFNDLYLGAWNLCPDSRTETRLKLLRTLFHHLCLLSVLPLQDAYKAKGCCKDKGKGKCQSACGGAKSAKCAKKQGVMVRADGSQWYHPTTLQVSRDCMPQGFCIGMVSYLIAVQACKG